MDSEVKRITDAVIAAIQSLGLMDEQTPTPQPAQIIYKDTPEVNPRFDPPPKIIVSPMNRNQSTRIFSALNVAREFPIQVTFFGVSNRSQVKGKGLIQQWKEQTWNAFLIQQPPILYIALPDMFMQSIVEGEPIDRRAWEEMYDVQVMFVLVEIEKSTFVA